MRIGLIAPPWVAVPPATYGGTESVLDYLARGLTQRGHDVVLFTVGESTCPVTRRHHYPQAFPAMGDVVAEVAHTLAAYAALADVDVIHDHTIAGPLVARAHHPYGPPVVVTHHGPFTPDMRHIFRHAAASAAVVAISRSQARMAGPVPISAVIHHGIDLDRYPPGPGGGGYLLFMGRMCHDKGVHRAIRVARRAGRRLVVTTKIRDAAEQDYFEHRVRPLLDADVELLIEPALDRRLDLLRHAEALVNPIRWPEPFGLVMAEALACATPVLAFPHGAAPEIVQHGRTGYLCHDEEAMVAAIGQVAALDRAQCRADAETRFGLSRMAAEHEALYRRILTDHRHPPVWTTPRPPALARPWPQDVARGAGTSRS